MGEHTGRPPTRAPNAVVAAPHAVASSTGLDLLRSGGSAVDRSFDTDSGHTAIPERGTGRCLAARTHRFRALPRRVGRPTVGRLSWLCRLRTPPEHPRPHRPPDTRPTLWVRRLVVGRRDDGLLNGVLGV